VSIQKTFSAEKNFILGISFNTLSGCRHYAWPLPSSTQTAQFICHRQQDSGPRRGKDRLLRTFPSGKLAGRAPKSCFVFSFENKYSQMKIFALFSGIMFL
jgi:hypothetical protein